MPVQLCLFSPNVSHDLLCIYIEGTNAFPEDEEQAGGTITLLDFRQHYKATVIQTAWWDFPDRSLVKICLPVQET